MLNRFYRKVGLLILTILPLVAKAGASGLETISARGGLDSHVLERFFATVSATADVSSGNESESAECFAAFDDTNESRSKAVSCLTTFGAGGLDANLFKRLFELRRPRMTRLPTDEMLRSLALLNYLEDLTRSRLSSTGQKAHWFVPEQGFLPVDSKEEFQFQDGDIVLGLGNSSISSLISQVTNPPGRYSHAFLIRVRSGKRATVESLIETGVKALPWSHFEKDKYNTLTVLRWKDPATRKNIARRASDAAFMFAQKRIGYDAAIDLDSDKKMFCTELVVKSYLEASGVSQEQILPHQAVVRSEAAFRHVQNLGVTNRTFVAPGDLLNSDLLEVVGEFRRTEDLFKAWKIFLMGDVFLDRLEEGYFVRPTLFYSILPLVVWVTQLVPSIFHEDLRLLPKSLTPGSFAVTATVEKAIYSRVFAEVDPQFAGKTKLSLLRTNLWDYRDALKKALNRNRWMTNVPYSPIGHGGD